MKFSLMGRVLAISSCCSIAVQAGTDVSPRCDSITLATGALRCVRARDDGTVDQRWDPASEPWAGEYVAANEPAENYCGPTAVKNFLRWYGMDEDYEVLGSEMRTNTWYTDTVFRGWGAAALLETVIKAGTLPVDLRAALDRRAPEGYTACIKQGDGNFEDIRSALAEGDQVVVLESRGTDKLHWTVATGLYFDGETLTLRLANSVDRSVDDFLRDWSLSRLGDPFRRSMLASFFGLMPYTMIRWLPTDLANGESCP